MNLIIELITLSLEIVCFLCSNFLTIEFSLALTPHLQSMMHFNKFSLSVQHHKPINKPGFMLTMGTVKEKVFIHLWRQSQLNAKKNCLQLIEYQSTSHFIKDEMDGIHLIMGNLLIWYLLLERELTEKKILIRNLHLWQEFKELYQNHLNGQKKLLI